MIHFILIALIILMLFLIVKEVLFKEKFISSNPCPPFTFLMPPENSLKSLSKGRCSVGGDSYIGNDIDFDSPPKQRNCYGEAISLSPQESLDTPSKAQCKK